MRRLHGTDAARIEPVTLPLLVSDARSSGRFSIASRSSEMKLLFQLWVAAQRHQFSRDNSEEELSSSVSEQQRGCKLTFAETLPSL